MAFLIDTNIAIDLRDGNEAVIERMAALSDVPMLSAISRVELEGGVYRDPLWAGVRRTLLDELLARLPVLSFRNEEALVYGAIVAALGYSRRQINDRMIAATALVHDLTLITGNAEDFRSVPGLKLDIW